MVVTESVAAEFAADWISAWNEHDLDRVLSHYAEDVVFRSPFVVKMHDASGEIRDKATLRSYFARAIEAYPDLKFELHTVLSGIHGVTLYYTSVKGLLAAETMLFNAEGKVAVVHAHYNHV